MHHNRTRRIAGGFAVVALMFAATAATAATKADPLEALAAMVGGTWVYEGVDDEGRPVVDRQVFEWMLGRQFIKIRQANRNQDRTYVTEAIVRCESENDTLEFWHFANSGKVSRGVITAAGGGFRLGGGHRECGDSGLAGGDRTHR